MGHCRGRLLLAAGLAVLLLLPGDLSSALVSPWAKGHRVQRARCSCRCSGGGETSDDELKAGPSALPLPIGPLCPARSEFWAGLATDSYAGSLEAKQRVLAGFMTRLQMGEKLEPEEEVTMCKEMKESNEMWRATNMRMRYAQDFQALENYKFVEARLNREGITMAMVEALMVWQPQQMEAMFQRRPPPPLPPEVDMSKVQMASQRMPSIMNSLMSSPAITSMPTPEGDLFENDMIREECQAIIRDHQQLILFGKGYGSFDPRGKEAFLQQLEGIEERWTVLLTRFQLMGALNPEYVQEHEAYLKHVGLTIVEFNGLLRDAHELMLKEAQQEGLQR